MTAVAVKTQPAKTSFEAGADLDFAGGVLEVTYASGAKASVNMDAEGVSFSARNAQETAGSQSVTVTYGGKSAALTVTVTAKTENPDGKTDKGGCGGALFGGSIAGALVLALAAGALLLRKKQERE